MIRFDSLVAEETIKAVANDGREYQPEVFNSIDIESAKEIIVTAEVDGSMTTEQRWEKETPFLVNEIGKYLQINPETIVLDYGCGIGRIAKGLIETYGCRVIGIDFNQTMRLLAPDYVLSDKFIVWSPETLAKMVEKGFRVDCAFSVWAIQHILMPTEALRLISNSMKSAGLFYALNSPRCVPTNKGFTNDGLNVQDNICETFEELGRKGDYLPANVASIKLNAISTMQLLRKRE